MDPIASLLNSVMAELLKLQGQGLVLALLIGVGYLLKLTPIFPNSYIPHAIILLGAGLNPCVVGRGHVDPEVNNPLVHLVLQGFLIGIAAFALHHLVIAKIEDKIKASIGGGKTGLMLACLLSLTACTTLQSIDWTKIVGAIANAGLTMVLRNNPEAGQWIGVTQSILDSFIARKTTDLSVLERDLQQVPAEWREVIKIALDEAGTKIGTALTENEKLALLEQYLVAIRNGVANVGKPASNAHSREYQRAREILQERGFKVSQFPASRGFAQSIPSPEPPAEGWKRLWLPVVAWADCPVTPDKMARSDVPPWFTPNLIARY